MTLKGRALMLTLFLVMGFSGLSARLIIVQIFQHDEWEARAEKDYTRKIIEPAERGVIFDRDGEQWDGKKGVTHGSSRGVFGFG